MCACASYTRATTPKTAYFVNLSANCWHSGLFATIAPYSTVLAILGRPLTGRIKGASATLSNTSLGGGATPPRWTFELPKPLIQRFDIYSYFSAAARPLRRVREDQWTYPPRSERHSTGKGKKGAPVRILPSRSDALKHAFQSGLITERGDSIGGVFLRWRTKCTRQLLRGQRGVLFGKPKLFTQIIMIGRPRK